MNNNISVDQYQPKTINDIVFGNPASKLEIELITQGRKPFPTFGKNGILIHGMWGTGKTTLAKMLPEAIEMVLSGKPLNDETFIQCKQGANGADLMRRIEAQSALISANYSDKHYFVLDEVDNLTDAAQASLKAAMNRNSTLFIMTTNHIDKVERGIINRSILIDMNAAPPQDWLPLAHRMLNDYGVKGVSNNDLLKLIASCKGSARDIADGVLTIIARASTSSTTP